MAQEESEVKAADLPIKKGPKAGSRGFTDEEEVVIYRFVKMQGNPPEQAAVSCRTTKTTIDNVCKRAFKRMAQCKGRGAA